MEYYSFTKRPNNTELYKGNTKQHYLRLKNDEIALKIFNEENVEYDFIADNGDNHKLRYKKASNGEYRIVGLKGFMEGNNLDAGCYITLELVRFNDGTELRFIKSKQCENVFYLNKSKDGFEILNEGYENIVERDLIEKYTQDKIKIKEVGEKEKRADSPRKTKFYDIIRNDKSIAKDYKNNYSLELKVYLDENLISILPLNKSLESYAIIK
ncbi:hypothetical protein P5E41_07330 [Clostridium perfringens]|uniref:hypothetical protein n=1 Tax=Clostridium perfringens TaxID=1502 RepID=UPI001ABA774A|nr:hypothetical protein [Clostridium perfringens]MBO3360787.1 hypothetical protein [Clostridium perfringens]MDK0843097.1 hypothetical protein [Clostridium perfringens]